MKLIVHEVPSIGSVSQVFIPQKNVSIEAIRPHLYRHNFPIGGLSVQIFDNSNNLIATSETINFSNIGTQNFFHGYIRFYVNAYLAKGERYTFKLSGQGGYSFNESAYCGWCNGYDLSKYRPETTPISNLNYPLDMEIWERKNENS